METDIVTYSFGGIQDHVREHWGIYYLLLN